MGADEYRKPGMQSDMSDEMCVPVESLAQPDEGEQMVNPEVGDPVAMHVEGKVTRIEGGNAYVKPETVNGKPLDSKSAKTADDNESQEKAQLYDMASAMDSSGAGGQMGGMGA